MAENTKRLVAPELLTALDSIPTLAFNDDLVKTMRDLPADTFLRGQPPLSVAQQAIQCEERYLPGPPDAPDVRVLHYTPPVKDHQPRPALLHIHGGGYIIGSPELNDSANRALAAALDCVIVSVDYRLAPETRFPGSVHDCYAALLWLHNHAGELGVDQNRIAIGGESAGGGLAAALAIHARERGEVPVCLQLLDCPMLDDRTGSTSDPHPFCGEFVWTPENNRFGWSALLGVEPGGADVPEHAVPARVRDLNGLPPAFIIVGALDLLMEENLEYARRLVRAGVATELHVIPGAYHGFSIATDQAPQVRTAKQLTRAALSRAWSHTLP